jgi:ABC-2 type transport system permease protein
MALITRLDPLTYGVDGLRGALINAWQFNAVVDLSILAMIAAVFVTAGAYLFSKIEV